MRVYLTSAITLTIALMAGCNNAKSPDTVAKDVAVAERKASNEVAATEKDATKDLGKAADKVDDKMTALNNAAAKDVYDITVARADGDRKIALAKCNALSGDAQKMCKDQADADYNATKATAKAAETSDKQ
jgi:hypothetical protein